MKINVPGGENENSGIDMGIRPTLKLLFAALMLVCLAQAASAATVHVAASDSTAELKSQADYICDGYNDQVEIQAAINALPASGGEVVLAEGKFSLGSSVTLKSNTVLRGAGEEKTILTFSSGRVDISGVQYVTVGDFKLLGTGAVFIKNAKHITAERIYAYDISNVQWGAFQVRADSYVTEDIKLIDCTADYIARHGFVNDGTNGGLIKDMQFIRCKALSCGLHNRITAEWGTWVTGFDITETVDIENVLLDSCVADNNWESGFHIEYFPKKTNVTFINCLSTNNGRVKQYSNDEKIWMAGYTVSGDVTLINCTAENNMKGIFFNTGHWAAGGVFVDVPGTPKFINFHDDGSNIGLYMLGARRGVLENCVFENSETYAIYDYKSWDITFDNCDFVNPAGVNGVYIQNVVANSQDWSGVNLIFDENYQYNPVQEPTPEPTPVPTPEPTPVPTEPLAVPGIVAIEQYDAGGEGVAYHDTTAGNQENTLGTDDVDIVTRSWYDGYLIGYIDEGEWINYTVNVEEAGVYDVELLVYAKNAGRTLSLAIDGEEACTIEVPAGGDWTTPLNPTAQVTFPTAGEHVVTLTFAGGDMNVGPISFALAGPVPEPAPEGMMVLPGIVAVEQYDAGGEGVAYHDTTAGNQENTLRDDDVDIVTRSWNDGYLIGYIAEGEWINYTVYVEAAGTYDVEFLVYTKIGGRTLSLAIDGEEACTVEIPAGGSWTTPLNPTAQVTFPTAGEHVLTMAFAGGDMNVGPLTFERSN